MFSLRQIVFAFFCRRYHPPSAAAATAADAIRRDSEARRQAFEPISAHTMSAQSSYVRLQQIRFRHCFQPFATPIFSFSSLFPPPMRPEYSRRFRHYFSFDIFSPGWRRFFFFADASFLAADAHYQRFRDTPMPRSFASIRIRAMPWRSVCAPRRHIADGHDAATPLLTLLIVCCFVAFSLISPAPARRHYAAISAESFDYAMLAISQLR
jgi:hypothetical protein